MDGSKRKKCFVITPIGDDFTETRRHIEGLRDQALNPAFGSDYDVVIAHDLPNPGSITWQVIQEIFHSELVVANLTGNNPNVLYELGLRHCIGKPVITIVEKGSKVPSDLTGGRYIAYINDPKGMTELKENLIKALKSINLDQKSGPVHEVFPKLQIATTSDAFKESFGDEATMPDYLRLFEHILSRLDSLEKRGSQSNCTAMLNGIVELLHQLESKCVPIDHSAVLNSILTQLSVVEATTSGNQEILKGIDRKAKTPKENITPKANNTSAGSKNTSPATMSVKNIHWINSPERVEIITFQSKSSFTSQTDWSRVICSWISEAFPAMRVVGYETAGNKISVILLWDHTATSITRENAEISLLSCLQYYGHPDARIVY